MIKFSHSAFDKAYAQINERRDRALSELDKHRAEIQKKAPEIAILNQRILETSVELSKAIISKRGNIDKIIEEIKSKNLYNQQRIRELLTAYGYPEDYLKAKFTCSNCSDTGFRDGIRCDCLNELIKYYSVMELNESCKIKLHDFSEFSLDYYSSKPDEISGIIPREKMKNLFDLCVKYADTFKTDSESLFFMGKTGLGKTFLSSMIAKELLNKGYKVAFDSISNFLIKAENEHFGRSQGNTFESLCDADLVILDDLGSEFSSPFNSSFIYNILNTRINAEKPTIVSTNLTASELNEKYNDRIVSRLTGMFVTVRFFGTDIRQIKRRMLNR